MYKRGERDVKSCHASRGKRYVNPCHVSACNQYLNLRKRLYDRNVLIKTTLMKSLPEALWCTQTVFLSKQVLTIVAGRRRCAQTIEVPGAYKLTLGMRFLIIELLPTQSVLSVSVVGVLGP